MREKTVFTLRWVKEVDISRCDEPNVFISAYKYTQNGSIKVGILFLTNHLSCAITSYSICTESLTLGSSVWKVNTSKLLHNTHVPIRKWTQVKLTEGN